MAYNNSITVKTCKCGCGKPYSLGYQGWRFSCATQEIKDKVGSKKKVAAKNKANLNALSRKLHIEQNKVSGAEMNRWHNDRRSEAKGFCSNCGGVSCKNNDNYYKFSNAHILPKEFFKSVKTHPLNCIELCYFENGCHPKMDNKLLDLTEMSCWDEIITKFVAMYPSIAENEKRRIPSVLLQYIQTEK